MILSHRVSLLSYKFIETHCSPRVEVKNYFEWKLFFLHNNPQICSLLQFVIRKHLCANVLKLVS